jgi:methionine biosynthesis protein MetW
MSASERLDHVDYELIAELVAPNSTVLDLGCGNGELLQLLTREKGVVGRGVDIEEAMIRSCIAKGLSVFHGNLDEGLKDYPTASYDYVILNRTMQVVHEPVLLLTEMLRVGRHGIVNFPNFGHWINRIQLGLGGRMPVNRHLPFAWHNTPNIHFFTRRDFRELCRELGMQILAEIDIRTGRRARPIFPNLFATECCVLLQGASSPNLDLSSA